MALLARQAEGEGHPAENQRLQSPVPGVQQGRGDQGRGRRRGPLRRRHEGHQAGGAARRRESALQLTFGRTTVCARGASKATKLCHTCL